MDGLLPLPNEGLFLRPSVDPSGNSELAAEVCFVKDGTVVLSGAHIISHGMNPHSLRIYRTPANVGTTGVFEADENGLIKVVA